METNTKRVRRTKKQIEEAKLLLENSIKNTVKSADTKKARNTKNVKTIITDEIVVLDIFDVDKTKAGINEKEYDFGVIMYIPNTIKESSDYFRKLKSFLSTIGYVSSNIDVYYSSNVKQNNVSNTGAFNMWFYTNNKFNVKLFTKIISKFTKNYNKTK